MIHISDLIESDTLRNAILFSVGSLYFDVDEKEFKNWGTLVKEALESLPTVSEIEVEVYIKEDANFSGDSDRLYPTAARTEFTVHLSEVTQRKLLEKIDGNYPQGVAEEFRVVTVYGYHAPVTFVIPKGIKDQDYPSTAVIVVREYLESAMKESASAVRPNIIGPSPFHGNFALILVEQDELFTLERAASSGYDAFIFRASNGAFETAGEACGELFEALESELEFYYLLQADRATRIGAANELTDLSGELIRIYENRGVLGKLRRAFTSSSKARYLAVKAIVAQYNSEVQSAQEAVDKDRLYSSDVEPYFKSDIEALMAEDHSGPTSGAREIATLISEVRARQIEVSSVFFSAIAGGAAGALISLFVHLCFIAV